MPIALPYNALSAFGLMWYLYSAGIATDEGV